MTKILTIDVGNTNVTLGLYVGNQLGPRWRLATENERMPDEYGLQFLGLLEHAGRKITELEGICLSSVVPPLTSRVIQACSQYLGLEPLVIGPDVKTGIKILYEEPAAIGADRIADVVAVNELYGGPACVVDFGTATTFNAITAKGEYLGGAIAPGMRIAADALTQRTAQLPRVEIKNPPSPIGKNTIHAMQSGILLGYVSLVEGMVNRFRVELGNDMKIIATGGMAEFIAPFLPTIQIVAPWLTLDGLRIIWEMNNRP